MQLPTFPIFSMKHMNNKIIAGGGGGNEEYGKKNGIVVYDNECNLVAYFHTEDVILDIQLISEDEIKEEHLVQNADAPIISEQALVGLHEAAP